MGKVGVLKRGLRRGGRRRRRRGNHALCLIIALCMFCSMGVVVSATPGDDDLDEREDQLAKLAAAVRENDVHKCEHLKTCTVTNCSRNTCLPGEGDVRKYSCIPVTFNKYCNASAPRCLDKFFDYTRSFVRTAGNTDFDSVMTTTGTCAQRALDTVFQSISKPESLITLYFGAVDGSFRRFPGSDQDVNNPECIGAKSYDNRLRPWYRAATYVPKVVIILVDAVQSMSAPLSSGQGKTGTILDAAKVIVREFVKTLYVQDYVNIIMFDSTKATPLSSMVQVQPYRNLSDTTFLPELDPLLLSLEKQKSEDQPGTGTSDVAKGMNAALSSFATINLDAAKIVLVLSDGKFAQSTNSSIPVTNLTAANVKVFIYKIPQANDGTLFLGNTSFANQLCSIGASFEVISSHLSNPLLALTSFFTFTATLHAVVTNNSVDYSIIFPGYEQIGGNITTVSMPVFSANKTLLGVVGLDIHIEYLGNLTSLVQAAIQDRSRGQVFKSADFKLTNGGCSQLQNEVLPAAPCPGVAIPQKGGFCSRTDHTSTIEDLACCGSCAKHKKDGVKPGTIIAVAVVAPLAVIGVVGLLLWLIFRKNRENPVEIGHGIREFSGPLNQAPQPLAESPPAQPGGK